MGANLFPQSSADLASSAWVGMAEMPDVETSSRLYATRFTGDTGRYLLSVQTQAMRNILGDLAPGTLLDVGGAHGQLVVPLRNLGWEVSVHGSTSECLRNLHELHGIHDCPFIEGPLPALPVPDASFDVVTAVRLLTHLNDWQSVLGELCRVARRAVVIDYPTHMSINALGPALLGAKRAVEHTTRPYVNFRRQDLERCFAQHGFAAQREIKQFVLPMVLHRLAGRVVRWPEEALRQIGVTRLFGSPVIMRADRSLYTSSHAQELSERQHVLAP